MVTLTQPLLKNGWGANTARVARGAKKQGDRRALGLTHKVAQVSAT